MATANTGYQMATNLTVRQGNDARVYSLLGQFVADAPYSNIKYGFLYNWYATQEQGTGVWLVSDAMRAAGWGVASETEWETLRDNVEPTNTGWGTGNTIGNQLKESGTLYWESTTINVTNIKKYNARGNGLRAQTGVFTSIIRQAYIWMIDRSSFYGCIRFQSGTASTSSADNVEQGQRIGAAIRPVRPATTAEQLLPDGELSGVYYYGNDGKVYRVTKIGTQVWVADNLAETKWSDGSWIQGYDGGTYTPITDANWAALTTAALCAYGDDESNVLGHGAASTIYPALTAAELALLSLSEFNSRVTAFLHYVSEQEEMNISDVITNSERLVNETACPIPAQATLTISAEWVDSNQTATDGMGGYFTVNEGITELQRTDITIYDKAALDTYTGIVDTGFYVDFAQITAWVDGLQVVAYARYSIDGGATWTVATTTGTYTSNTSIIIQVQSTPF